jgi:ATP-dependent Clp protease adaptor protein ClpS
VPNGPPRVFAAGESTESESETDTATLTRLGRPWHVVVHDDPVTLMTYVVEVFREVFGYPEGRARKLMLEVHHKGRSIVWTGARERAELYVTKLQARHLLATLERSED